MTLLVTGATGTVGGSLLPLLTVRGEAVRAMVPSPEEADDLRGYDVEIVVADFDRPETIDDALLGVSAVFLGAPAGSQLAGRELAFLDAVERSPDRPFVVVLASLGWEDPRSRFAVGHGQVVERLRTAGLRHTVLAPNGFLQDVLRYAAMVQEHGALLLPVGDAAVSLVDARDVAAVAAHILTNPDAHDGRSYPVTGPMAVTFADVAQGIGAVAGRDVRYVDSTPDDVRKRLLGYGWTEYTADGMLEVYAVYAAGAASLVTDEVEKATGQPARSLETFLADHAAAFRTV